MCPGTVSLLRGWSLPGLTVNPYTVLVLHIRPPTTDGRWWQNIGLLLQNDAVATLLGGSNNCRGRGCSRAGGTWGWEVDSREPLPKARWQVAGWYRSQGYKPSSYSTVPLDLEKVKQR